MPEVKFTDPRAFSAALTLAGKQVPAKVVSAVQQKLLLLGLRRVIERTPVDTGRARGNWQVSEGAPVLTTVDTTDKSGGQTLRNGTGAIAALKPYTAAFITNNLRYIEVLEYGLYPRPGDKQERFADFSVSRGAPIKVKRFTFRKTKDGRRKRVKLSDRSRARLYAEAGPKVTDDGYSRKAPRGMVRITFEEMRAGLAKIASGVERVSISSIGTT